MGVGGAREMGVGGAREMGSLLSIHFYPNSR